MRFYKYPAALSLCVLLLSACGGGGGGDGGGGGGSATADKTWLTFTPNPVSVAANEGQSTWFTINAKSSRTISQVFNIGIVEPTGMVTTDVALSPVSQYEYNATLRTNPTKGAGSYTGTLEVRLCEDDPRVCSKPISGSPWFVPMTLAVKPATVATPPATPPTTTPSPQTPPVVTPPAPLPPVTLQFNLASVDVTTYDGEAATVSLSAGASRALLGNNVAVIDSSGLLASSTNPVDFSDALRFNTFVRTAEGLSVGKHSGTLQVRACIDSVDTCSQPVSGSPWTLPISVNVVSQTNLKALTALPQVPDWSTYQGNAAHTGAIDANFDPARFTRRFNHVTTGTYTGGAVTEGANSFTLLHNSERGGDWVVQAVSAITGKELWRTSLGPLSNVNPPAAANGKVYLTSTGHGDSYLWILDQRDGSLLAKSAMSSQWEQYLAPTIANGAVYSNSGYYGGMTKNDDTDARSLWRLDLPQVSGWTPAVDGSYAYTYLNGTFYAVDNGSGSIGYKVTAFDATGYSAYGSSTVLGNGMLYGATLNTVTALNLNTRAVAWTLTDVGIGIQPAFGAGVLYVLNANGTILEARDPASGALRWVSNDLADRYTQVIVAGNLAFVASGSTTLAIDLATHKTVWTYPLGGKLSISNRGVLYIVSPQKLAAVNLR
jgi:hypothetical protein